MVSETDAIFASTSSDGTVYVWELVLPSTAGGKQVKNFSTVSFSLLLKFKAKQCLVCLFLASL